MKVKTRCLECQKSFIYAIPEIKPLIKYCSFNCYTRKNMIISSNKERWKMSNLMIMPLSLWLLGISLAIFMGYKIANIIS